ncbi:hypothetical protein NCLIV_060610 [Neospora caninum Liverpool]|uniref:Transmembrane protein n=1 Tax=Neospora caninum (strain Liverpool) TaxID=572307 RepID=F0VPJ0_NEOCL|nr:hypothetical protein NCLIV_060610 [Neospora caninum Liverpool]CBZ55636.1 hypothetical protein NCLIV_060610 [Neospora caninum Liverpool]CEL70378.1 TPA: hypothetical protein BN1204_060610 [Neospora caninum Liverpool]|eukprot:XP_003885664.1 hypothetical protein NCLIV_060610 [Neospora caninum Liverpool]
MRRGRGQQGRQGPSQPYGTSGAAGQGRPAHASAPVKEAFPKNAGSEDSARGEGGASGGSWLVSFFAFVYGKLVSALCGLTRLRLRGSHPASWGSMCDAGAARNALFEGIRDGPKPVAGDSPADGVFVSALGRVWGCIAGAYRCVEDMVRFGVLCLLAVWRVLCLQFCPRRRDYLLHAQGIAALGKLATAREQDEDWSLSMGTAGSMDPCGYMSCLINSTFFPLFPGFAWSAAYAAVSPFSSSAAAGLWASVSSIWPDFDDDYSTPSVARLTAALSVWTQSCRQLGTVLELSPDFSGRERNFYGATQNLAVRAVADFPSAENAWAPKPSGRCCRRRGSRAKSFASRFPWISFPGVHRSQETPVERREGGAGLFPYLLWWRWWPAAAVAAIPRRTGRRQSDLYSAPCYFPGVGRCVATGLGPTSSSLEDYWAYARWISEAETADFPVHHGDAPPCPAAQLPRVQSRHPSERPPARPVFAPLLFTPELFPAVFGGWLFPVTGNPSFAALPFFRTLWWPAAVAAAGGGTSATWRLGPRDGATALGSSGDAEPGHCGCSPPFGCWTGSPNAGCGCRAWCTSAEKPGGDASGPCDARRKCRQRGHPSDCLETTLGPLPGGVPPVFLVNDGCLDSTRKAGGGGSVPQAAAPAGAPGSGNHGRHRNSGNGGRAGGKATGGVGGARQAPRGCVEQAPPQRSASTQRAGPERTGIVQWLAQLWTGSWLFADACRFCALNLRLDLRTPPASFFFPLSFSLLRQKLGGSAVPANRGGSTTPQSVSGQRGGTCKAKHAPSSAGSSSPSADACAREASGFFFYANAMQRCTCDILLPRRREGGPTLEHDGLFVPVSAVRAPSAGGHQAAAVPSGPRGGKHQGGRGGAAAGNQTGGATVAEAAAKFAQNQKQRLAQLPVHLHAAHCVLGLAGVPVTAAAVDEAYCRQLVLVGDPLGTAGGRGEGAGSRHRKEKLKPDEEKTPESEDVDDPVASGLLTGSFAGLLASSWRREYVFRRSEETREEQGGASHPGQVRPRFEDFCDLLGVLHRARTAIQLFLALTGSADTRMRGDYPRSGAGAQEDSAKAAEAGDAAAGADEGRPCDEDGRTPPEQPNGADSTPETSGAYGDLWSSSLFVPGPSAASFAARQPRGLATAGTASRLEDLGAEKNVPSFSLAPGIASGCAASAYLRGRREDAQRLVQAFVVSVCLARLRLAAAVQRFVTTREGAASAAQQGELRRLLAASAEWVRGDSQFANSSLTEEAAAGAPERLPPSLEFELSPHPLAVAVREGFPLLLRMLLADEAAASVFANWKGRGPGAGDECGTVGYASRAELLTHPWLFRRGYSVLADLGNGSTVLHFAARFGRTEVLQVVSSEVAPTTWWRCLIHRNDAGHTPLDVAILWHGVESDVVEVFAQAFNCAKEVQDYTSYLNRRNVRILPFVKAVAVTLIAIFLPAHLLFLPFFFSLFGDGPADEMALRLALLILLFLAEFVVRQTGCGEKIFSLYAGLAVGTAFSLWQIVSDLTHDVFVEEIYGESAVRVALLLMFFHYAATPSSVARVGECVGEAGPHVLGFVWRPLRRLGLACGLGGLVTRVGGWFASDAAHAALEGKGRTRAASQPGVQASSGTKSNAPSSRSGGGTDDGRESSGVPTQAGAEPARREGESSERQSGWLSKLRRGCMHLLGCGLGVVKAGWTAVHHSCDFRFLLRVVGLTFLLMSLTSSMISGWWLVTDDFTYAIFALNGSDAATHVSHAGPGKAAHSVHAAVRARAASSGSCSEGERPRAREATGAVPYAHSSQGGPAGLGDGWLGLGTPGASEGASKRRYLDANGEAGVLDAEAMFDDLLDLEEGSEFDFMPPPSFGLCHASLSSSSLLLSLRDVAREKFKKGSGGAGVLGAASLLSVLDRYPFMPEKIFETEAILEQAVEDETYGEVCRRWKAEQRREFEAQTPGERATVAEKNRGQEGGAQDEEGSPRTDAASRGHGAGSEESFANSLLEGLASAAGARKRDFLRAPGPGATEGTRPAEGAGTSEAVCLKLSPVQEHLLAFALFEADSQQSRLASEGSSAREDGVCRASAPGTEAMADETLLEESEADALSAHLSTRARRTRQRVCSGGRCSALRISPTAWAHGSLREKLEDEQADELCRWHMEETEGAAGGAGEAGGIGSGPECSPLSLQLMGYCVKRLENKLRKQMGLPAVDDESFYHAFRSRLAVRLLQPDAVAATEEEFARSVLPFVCLGCTEFDDVTGACLARDSEKRRRRQRQAMRCLRRVRTWHLQQAATAEQLESDAEVRREFAASASPAGGSPDAFYDFSGFPVGPSDPRASRHHPERAPPSPPKPNFAVVSGYNYYQLYRPHPALPASLASDRGSPAGEEALRFAQRQRKATALLSPPRWAQGIRRFSSAAFASASAAEKGTLPAGAPVTAALDAAATVGAMVAALCSFMDVDDSEVGAADDARQCPHCSEQILRVQQIREGLRCYRQLVLQILEKQRRGEAAEQTGGPAGRGDALGRHRGGDWSEPVSEKSNLEKESRGIEPDSEELLLGLLAMQRSGLLRGAKKLLRDGVVASASRRKTPSASPGTSKENFYGEAASDDRAPRAPPGPGSQAKASSAQRLSSASTSERSGRSRANGSDDRDAFYHRGDRHGASQHSTKEQVRRVSWIAVFVGLAVAVVGSAAAWLLYQCWVEHCAEWYSRQLQQEEDGLRGGAQEGQKRGHAQSAFAGASGGKGGSGRGGKKADRGGNGGSGGAGARADSGAGQGAAAKKAPKPGKGSAVSGTAPGGPVGGLVAGVSLGRQAEECREDAPTDAAGVKPAFEEEVRLGIESRGFRETARKQVEAAGDGATRSQETEGREKERKAEGEDAGARPGQSEGGAADRRETHSSCVEPQGPEDGRARDLSKDVESGEGIEATCASGSLRDSETADGRGQRLGNTPGKATAESNKEAPAAASEGRPGRRRKSDAAATGAERERRASKDPSSASAASAGEEDCGFVVVTKAKKPVEKKLKGGAGAVESGNGAVSDAGGGSAVGGGVPKAGSASKAAAQREAPARTPPGSSQSAASGAGASVTSRLEPVGRRDGAPGVASARKRNSMPEVEAPVGSASRPAHTPSGKARQRTGSATGSRSKTAGHKDSAVSEKGAPAASVWGGGLGRNGRRSSGADSPSAAAAEAEQVHQLQKLLAALQALNAAYDLARCQLPDWALDCLDEAQAVQLRERHGWKVVKRGDGAQEHHVLLVPEKVVKRFLQQGEQTTAGSVSGGRVGAPDHAGDLPGEARRLKSPHAEGAVESAGASSRSTGGKTRPRPQGLGPGSGEALSVANGGAEEATVSIWKKTQPGQAAPGVRGGRAASPGKAKGGAAKETPETGPRQQSPGRRGPGRKASTSGGAAEAAARARRTSLARGSGPAANQGQKNSSSPAGVLGGKRESGQDAGARGTGDPRRPGAESDALQAESGGAERSHRRVPDQLSSKGARGKAREAKGGGASGEAEGRPKDGRLRECSDEQLRSSRQLEAEPSEFGGFGDLDRCLGSTLQPLHLPADLLGDDLGTLHANLRLLYPQLAAGEVSGCGYVSQGPRASGGGDVARELRQTDQREGLERLSGGASSGLGANLPRVPSRQEAASLASALEEQCVSGFAGGERGRLSREASSGSVCDDMKPAHELLAAALLRPSHPGGYGSPGGWLPFASAPAASTSSRTAVGGPYASGAARSERQGPHRAGAEFEAASPCRTESAAGLAGLTGAVGSRAPTREVVHGGRLSRRSSADGSAVATAAVMATRPVERAWLFPGGVDGVERDSAGGGPRAGDRADGHGSGGSPGLALASDEKDARWLDFLSGGKTGEKRAATAAVAAGREEMLAVEQSFAQDPGADLASAVDRGGQDAQSMRSRRERREEDVWGEGSRPSLQGFVAGMSLASSRRSLGEKPPIGLDAQVDPHLDLTRSDVQAMQANAALAGANHLGSSGRRIANTASSFSAFFADTLPNDSPSGSAALREGCPGSPEHSDRATSGVDLLVAELDPVAAFLSGSRRRGAADAQLGRDDRIGIPSAQEQRAVKERVAAIGAPPGLELRPPEIPGTRRANPCPGGFGGAEDASGELEQGLCSVLSWAESVLEDEAGESGDQAEVVRATTQKGYETRADRGPVDEEENHPGSAASSPSGRTVNAGEAPAFPSSPLLAQDLTPQSRAYSFASSHGSRKENSSSLASSGGVEERMAVEPRAQMRSAEGVCLLCRMAPSSCVLEPCGHRALCSSCASMLCSEPLPVGGACRRLARKAVGAVCMHCLEEVSHIWFQ